MIELLPWERLLWRSRPLRPRPWLSGEQYYLTDFRVIRDARCGADEIALDDIGDIGRTESALDRWLGTSTVIVHAVDDDRPPFVIADVRRGAQLAAVLDIIANDRDAAHETNAIRAALTWHPRVPVAYHEAVGAVAAVLLAMTGVIIGLHGRPTAVAYASDDMIRPNGIKRDDAAIARFMEREVMPWARFALAPIVGADRVTCETCHGEEAVTRAWQMPAVKALPESTVLQRGFERYSHNMDAQMRNAIYGYSAESEKSAKAAYMREIVMPGMAALLHREPYDFTRSYEYNRSRNALGCYHCHRVQ